MKNRYKKILSRGDTVGGKQVQNDEVRDCHATARNDGESGRSMVEMLGVLAVIGVLSVAGIAGYTSAMNTYRANEAVNQALRLATIISGQRLINQNAALTSNDLTGTNFTMDATKTNEIVLTLTGVSDAVSNKIQNMGFKNAEVTNNNGTLTFTFNNDLTERNKETENETISCESDSNCPEGQLCGPYTKKCLSPSKCVEAEGLIDFYNDGNGQRCCSGLFQAPPGYQELPAPSCLACIPAELVMFISCTKDEDCCGEFICKNGMCQEKRNCLDIGETTNDPSACCPGTGWHDGMCVPAG